MTVTFRVSNDELSTLAQQLLNRRRRQVRMTLDDDGVVVAYDEAMLAEPSPVSGATAQGA